jgi:hypothetical protein
MMLAAARALPLLHAGAHSLFDLPHRVLWGNQGTGGEKEWMRTPLARWTPPRVRCCRSWQAAVDPL